MLLLGPLLSLIVIILSLVYTNVSANGQKGVDKGVLTQSFSPNWRTDISSKNHTDVDPEDNIRVFPHQFAQDHRKQEKKLKKNPKRTIQKIIKKNKGKKRIFHARRETTSIPEALEYSPEVTESQEQTQPPMRKSRTGHKLPKYLTPIHKLQFKKDSHRRQKRKVLERDNTFILKDFDGVKFLSKDGDANDVVSVSGKKFW